MPTKEYMREYRKKHPQTQEQLAQQKAYWKSAAGKAAKKRYRLTTHGRRKGHDGWLRREYSITLEQKEKMYNDQQGLCALCKQQLPDVVASCYDHNHTTGKARGILHHSCNTLIGIIENTPGVIQQIPQYLIL